ncbi:sigma-54-dependent transcriptional regulator [Lascolabacillus massiliensis]|uniref:sigma-54-dependent transcriptional regulator n=1 Tax=Lascolabacillus massiliensis TaxID=1627894 RepID=UPI0006B3497A|nr:response regulator [Lascolabacillus massiliensis]
MNKTILVIDDNLTVCLMLKSWLVKKGFNVDTASHAEEAKEKVRESPYDMILSDIMMPDTDGFAFLKWVKKYDPDILVIMMTGFADIDSAVEAMKNGAVDYISKPIDPEKLFNKIDEAFLKLEISNRNNPVKNDYITPPDEDYKQLFRQLNNTAENNTHLLILGDRGTGKFSAVKYIYEKGINGSKPLVCLDANDIVSKKSNKSQIKEGELKLKEKFENAKGGLFYVREIDQLNNFLQDDLLKIITRQSRDEEFTQVILSSEKKPEDLQKILTPKLYNLIIEDCVILPSLKGRAQQIIFFATHFLRFANFTLNKEITEIDPVIQKQLVEYDWPGNIQELKNIIIKAALLTEESVIKADLIDDLFNYEKSKDESQKPIKRSIQSLRKEYYEKEKICQALELAKGNKTMAASILNIDRKTLYNKIKLYNVKV